MYRTSPTNPGGNLIRPLLVAAVLTLVVSPGRATAQEQAAAASYQDDRSSPESVVESYYNAINLKQYARAYGYWDQDAAVPDLPPCDDFRRGYNQADSVQVTVGSVVAGVAAGNLSYLVPVVLVATMTDSSVQWFVGCYRLHLAQPLLQTMPPNRPMGIRAAKIASVDAGGDPDALLSDVCPQPPALSDSTIANP